MRRVRASGETSSSLRLPSFLSFSLARRRVEETTQQNNCCLGYRIVYVSHSVVTDHIAAYNLIYGGRHFTAPNRRQQKERNETLKVPLNQIWISKR